MLLTDIKRLPDRDMIRSLAMRSGEPFFKTDEFWMELARYSPRKFWEPSAREELRQIKRRTFSTKAVEKVLETL